MKMRQKTIIQVWGRHGRGKTETIKITHQELIKKYINKAHAYTLPFPNTHDITELLLCDGKKVGIDSMGDDLNYRYYSNPTLKERLDDFIVNQNVDILLCASRVYNNASAYIKHLADTYDYRIIKVAPYIINECQFVKEEVNKLAAEHIVSIVNSIIKGRI